MIRFKWLVVLIAIFLASTVSAEIYMFKDKNGNTVFTDDITRVPRNQQPGVQKYKEYQAETEKSEPEGQKEKPATSPAENSQEGTPPAGVETADIVKRFDRIKLELDEEYQALDKEKQRLDRLKTNLQGKNTAAEYNKSVSALNERIEVYEKKKEAFNAEVEKYNAKVKEDIQKILESKQPEK